MTEPSTPRPVPGPPRPVPVPAEPAASGAAQEAPQQPEDPFVDLDARPVSEHVGVFESEHARLERELGTIDRL